MVKKMALSFTAVYRFGCEKLILVGDPNQLDPTLEGSEAAHQNGLGQTLFDRLLHMVCTPGAVSRKVLARSQAQI